MAREFEAEAVAYLVTERLDLDLGSVEYLSVYLTDEKNIPEYSLYALLKPPAESKKCSKAAFVQKEGVEAPSTFVHDSRLPRIPVHRSRGNSTAA